MLPLKLYPSEFLELIRFLRFCTERQDFVPLQRQSVGLLVLIQYRRSWKAERLVVWSQRQAGKRYKLSLPLPVARALYDELQVRLIFPSQQQLLSLLDQAIVNYRNPLGEAHVLGELLGSPDTNKPFTSHEIA